MEGDPYKLLGLEKNCSEQEVTRAYRRQALQWHPDKQAGRPAELQDLAKENFRNISEAYRLLTDPKRRAKYDRTGSWAEGSADPVDYSALYREVSKQDLDDFELQYRSSAEELQDVKSAYTICQGDMTKILESVMCSQAADGPRFKELIDAAIASGELPKFPKWPKTTTPAAHQRRMKAADKEAEKAAKQPGFDDLAEQIRARRGQNESKLDALLLKIESEAQSQKSGRRKK